jgi:hypothetical protein
VQRAACETRLRHQNKQIEALCRPAGALLHEETELRLSRIKVARVCFSGGKYTYFESKMRSGFLALYVTPGC